MTFHFHFHSYLNTVMIGDDWHMYKGMDIRRTALFRRFGDEPKLESPTKWMRQTGLFQLFADIYESADTLDKLYVVQPFPRWKISHKMLILSILGNEASRNGRNEDDVRAWKNIVKGFRSVKKKVEGLRGPEIEKQVARLNFKRGREISKLIDRYAEDLRDLIPMPPKVKRFDLWSDEMFYYLLQ